MKNCTSASDSKNSTDLSHWTSHISVHVCDAGDQVWLVSDDKTTRVNYTDTSNNTTLISPRHNQPQRDTHIPIINNTDNIILLVGQYCY